MPWGGQSGKEIYFAWCGGAEYKYDDFGNLIKDDRAEYAYNCRNMITGARVGLSDITYKYDPFGRRIARNNVKYTYDSFSVIRESSTGFIGKRKVSYLLGSRLDEILSRKASPVVYYYQDIQGSIRGLTGSDSKPIQAYEYTAFGERHVSSRSKQFLLLDKLIDQPYGFTGRPKEELTGLYYYRYRDYNPQTGRFLQPDPLGQLPGPNIYSYCQNNPVNWVDPWGMDIYYNYFDGGHASVVVPDSESSTGYSEYSYHPVNGGYDDPLATINSPGEMEKFDSNPDEDSIRIPTTQKQDEAAKEKGDEFVENPGTYNPGFNNCTGPASEIIEASGLGLDWEFINTPNALKENVEEALKKKKDKCGGGW